MKLIGVEFHAETSGETTHDSGWLLGWKWRGWAVLHEVEANMRVIQFGPLILEIWWS